MCVCVCVCVCEKDFEGWWLSGCCGSVAKHWRLKPEVSWVRPSATFAFFTFLYFYLITSKFIYFQHEARCSEQIYNKITVCLEVWYAPSDNFPLNHQVTCRELLDIIKCPLVQIWESGTCYIHSLVGMSTCCNGRNVITQHTQIHKHMHAHTQTHTHTCTHTYTCMHAHMYCTSGTQCLSRTPGSHSVCTVRTLLGLLVVQLLWLSGRGVLGSTPGNFRLFYFPLFLPHNI